jgi:hypothetical protein
MKLNEGTRDSLGDIQGKTILRSVYGPCEPSPLAHRGQLIVLYFTDGSALSILCGTNAGDFCEQESDLRVDLTAVLYQPGEEVLRPVKLEPRKVSDDERTSR